MQGCAEAGQGPEPFELANRAVCSVERKPRRSTRPQPKGTMKSPRHPQVLVLAVGLATRTPHAKAGSATWNLNPTSGDWNTAANWVPNTVPNAPDDIATFGVSNLTGISLSADTEANAIMFNAGAEPFTISANVTHVLTLSGSGMINNSAAVQNFVAVTDPAGNFGSFFFTDTARVGPLVTFTVNGGASLGLGGLVHFLDDSSAGQGVFNQIGGPRGAAPGGVQFFDTSDAGTAAFLNQSAAAAGGAGGFVEFYDDSSAGAGIFVNKGGT